MAANVLLKFAPGSGQLCIRKIRAANCKNRKRLAAGFVQKMRRDLIADQAHGRPPEAPAWQLCGDNRRFDLAGHDLTDNRHVVIFDSAQEMVVATCHAEVVCVDDADGKALWKFRTAGSKEAPIN